MMKINQCHFGDCRDVLKQMIADGVRVNTVITSPPYWGLRDYGTATWEGGDNGCDHQVKITKVREELSGGGCATWSTRDCSSVFTDICGKCGARRIDAQLGLEPTLAEYVANMTEVFGLVREVLADDGVLFLNLGDSYAGASRRGESVPSGKQATNNGTDFMCGRGAVIPDGLKPKDLCGVPWRVAFALQEAGWWLRQDLVWHKPNPMPESVTDRCTKAHEYVFLMTKSARYFFDAEAIKEPIALSTASDSRLSREGYDVGRPERGFPGGASRGGGLLIPRSDPSSRNKRSVWTIPTAAYSEAHFATFPEALVEPMILAGTSAHGHCPACGKGWVRVVEQGELVKTNFDCGNTRPYATGKDFEQSQTMAAGLTSSGFVPGHQRSKTTLGWEPSCAHNLVPVRGVVLDPFLGSGTVGRVAQSLGRNWLGIELNPAYEEFQDNRITQYGMAF